MVTIQDFGGWDAVQVKYFHGGMFDRIFAGADAPHSRETVKPCRGIVIQPPD